MKRTLPLFSKPAFADLFGVNRRTYSLCLCVLGVLFLINDARAGNAEPAGSTTPSITMAGTYTVGSGGDYLTLTSAINDYNSATLGGAVIFSLTDANYNAGESFPIVVNRNPNASSINTLTIRPASGVSPAISGSLSGAALIKILGNYITIDGSNNGITNGASTRNLSITNTATITPYVVWLGSSAGLPVAFSGIKNCIITNGSASVANTAAITVCDGTTINTAGYFNNIGIENNLIKKSNRGIHCIGVNASNNGLNLSVLSNDLSSTLTNAIYYCGIYLQDIDGAMVKDNVVGNFTGIDPGDDVGIYVSSGVKNTSVFNNKVLNLNYTGGSGYGAHGIRISSAVTGANITVANNMIANITGDGFDYTNAGAGLDNPTGILLTSTQTGIKIYHNSINLGTTGFTNTLNRTKAISACIRLYTGSNAEIKNNILVNKLGRAGSGTTGYGSIAILVSTNSTQLTSIDYNDYVVSPTGSGLKLFGQINLTAYDNTSLPTWASANGGDGHSLSVVPVFATATDLHLSPAASNTGLNNAGTFISSNTTDFDNTTRNGLLPDIGCDEFLAPNTCYWVGKTSTDWQVASNWETNTIPGGATDVYISGGYTYMPSVTSTQAIKGLFMSAPGAAPVLTINNGDLQINGAITRTGGWIDGANGTVEMNGTAAQTIPASLFAGNKLRQLIIGNSNATTGVTLAGTLDIYKSLGFSASGLKLTTNDYLVFKSTAIETASLGDVTGKTIVGNATVERYLPATNAGPGSHGKSWQLLSVPVSGTQTVNAAWQEGAATATANPNSGYGTQISGDVPGATSLGFDASSGTPSMKVYNSATGLYTGIANTNSLPISNQKGYMIFVRGDRSVTGYNQTAVPTILRATGKLYTTGTDLPPSSNVAADKFESIGNPYASSIDFLALTKSPGVDNTYYVWDPLLPGSGYGAYQTISAVAGWLPSPGGTSNYPSGVAVSSIQSGQAFFVHATGGAGTVSFSEAAKVSGSKMSFRAGDAINISALYATLYNGTDSTAGIADGNIIAFSSDYTNEYNGDDALKFVNGSANFGIFSSGRLLAVEARNNPSANDTVFYSLTNLRKQGYQFRFIAREIPVGYNAFLVDRFLQISTPVGLSGNTAINFNVNDDPASAATDRFYIIFQQLQVLPLRFKNISATRLSENDISVNWIIENETGVKNYELQHGEDGHAFAGINSILPANNNGSNITYTIVDDHPVQGDNFYRVKATGISGQVIYSQVVKVTSIKVNASFNIYPNPVPAKQFSLVFNNKPAGNYQVQVINQSGQNIYSNKLNFNGNNDIKSISLSSQTAAGNYRLMIISEDGTMEIKQIVIE